MFSHVTQETKQEKEVGPAISISKKMRWDQKNCLALVPGASPVPANYFFFQPQTSWLPPFCAVYVSKIILTSWPFSLLSSHFTAPKCVPSWQLLSFRSPCLSSQPLPVSPWCTGLLLRLPWSERQKILQLHRSERPWARCSTGIASSKCSAPVREICWPEHDTGRQREMVEVQLQSCLWSATVRWAGECVPDVFFHPGLL